MFASPTSFLNWRPISKTRSSPPTTSILRYNSGATLDMVNTDKGIATLALTLGIVPSANRYAMFWKVWHLRLHVICSWLLERLITVNTVKWMFLRVSTSKKSRSSRKRRMYRICIDQWVTYEFELLIITYDFRSRYEHFASGIVYDKIDVAMAESLLQIVKAVMNTGQLTKAWSQKL